MKRLIGAMLGALVLLVPVALTARREDGGLLTICSAIGGAMAGAVIGESFVYAFTPLPLPRRTRECTACGEETTEELTTCPVCGAALPPTLDNRD